MITNSPHYSYDTEISIMKKIVKKNCLYINQ